MSETNEQYAKGWKDGLLHASYLANLEAVKMRNGEGVYDDFEWSSREVRDAVLAVANMLEDEAGE